MAPFLPPARSSVPPPPTGQAETSWGRTVGASGHHAPQGQTPGVLSLSGVPSCCIWGASVPAPVTALDLTNSHCGQGPGGDWPGGTVNQGSWVLSSLSHSGRSWEKWAAAVGPPGLCRPWKEPTSQGTQAPSPLLWACSRDCRSLQLQFWDSLCGGQAGPWAPELQEQGPGSDTPGWEPDVALTVSVTFLSVPCIWNPTCSRSALVPCSKVDPGQCGPVLLCSQGH